MSEVAGPTPAASESSTPDGVVTLDADGRIATDLVCDQCGYNLRTLHHTAACPECGCAVGESLRPDDLVFAPREYLRRMAAGASWLTVVAGTLLAMLWVVACAFALVPTMDAAGAILVLCSFVVVVLTPFGVVLITARDPRKRSRIRDLPSRRVLRYATAAAGVFLVLAFWSPPFGVIGFFLTSSVVPAIHWAYLQALLLRAPAPTLARRAQALLALHIISAVVLILGVGMMVSMGRVMATVVGVCVFAALTIYLGRGISLLRQTSRELERLADERPDASSQAGRP